MDASVGDIIWTFCYLTVLGGLSLYGVHRYAIVYLYLRHRHDKAGPQSQFDSLPRVTVQLPVFNEYYVVDRLLQSVSELDYPRDLLQIQVLDDSTDETRELTRDRVDALRARGFDVELIRRADRAGFKAGALAAGMATCQGEFILILDADFVPPPNLLRDTVHYFTNEKVGMIQTRWGHINRTYSLLTRVQAMFLDGHLLLEQTARSRSGRFINFNGTAGLWRRTCIESAGGWQHDTLTEDLDLSYRAQIAGWKFMFLPGLVTPGELPADMNGFKTQQHRWTKGSVQTCKKLLPAVWRSKLPWVVKIEATAHLTSNFGYLLMAFLCVVLYPASHTAFGGLWRLILIDIPIFLAASLSVAIFYICAQRELNPERWVKEILFLPMLLALGIGLSINNARAVLEAVFNRQSGFIRTPKYGIGTKTHSWRKTRYRPLKPVLPMIELAFALYFTWVVVSSLTQGAWISLPFLLLFQVGFGYVALSSILQSLPRFTFGHRVSREAVPA
jgi:cellulose synthase/poly-beta-1,6-N-acetylglucosamine synthase-like glycosyltransferase